MCLWRQVSWHSHLAALLARRPLAYHADMLGSYWRSNRACFVPAFVVGVLLIALWGWARWVYLPEDARRGELGTLCVGWMFGLLLAASLATIGWTASVQEPRRLWRIFLGTAAIAKICGLLLLIVGLGSGILRFVDILKALVVLTSWLVALSAMVAALRRWGAGMAVMGTGLIAVMLLAVPVTLMPVVRVAGQSRQAGAVVTITHLCPSLAMLAAVWDSVPLEWGKMNQMYHLTALGQDVPMNLPAWWLSTGLFLAMAGMGAVIGRAKRRSTIKN